MAPIGFGLIVELSRCHGDVRARAWRVNEDDADMVAAFIADGNKNPLLILVTAALAREGRCRRHATAKAGSMRLLSADIEARVTAKFSSGTDRCEAPELLPTNVSPRACAQLSSGPSVAPMPDAP